MPTIDTALLLVLAVTVFAGSGLMLRLLTVRGAERRRVWLSVRLPLTKVQMLSEPVDATLRDTRTPTRAEIGRQPWNGGGYDDGGGS